jgi:hypothetical protein
MAFLQVGHAAVRVLEQFVPDDPRVILLPLWTAGLQIAAACLLLWAGRGVREGRPAARVVGVVWIVAWIAATFLSINTQSLDLFHFGHVAVARAGVWRATAWPAFLGCLGEFEWRPTGRWRPPEWFAAGLTDVLGIAMIATLAKTIPLPAGASESRDARLALARVALLREEARPSAMASVVRALLALHVAFMAVFLVLAVIGLSARIAGWKMGT